MIEIIAILASVAAGAGAFGTAGYQCYKTCKKRNEPTVIVQQDMRTPRHPDHRESILDSIVAREMAKKRTSGDSDTNVDIRINIHTHEEGNEKHGNE